MDLARALAQPPNDSSHKSAQKTALNRPSRIETIPLEILTRIFSICRDDVWIWDDNRDPEEDDGDENKIDPESIFDPRVALCFWAARTTDPALLWDIRDSLPAPTTLQLVWSLDISIIGTSETSPGPSGISACSSEKRAAPSVVKVIQYKPVDTMSHIFHPDFFPWHQLTKLTSMISVTITTARDILRHLDILHQPPLCILYQMGSLDLSTTGDLPFIGFFDSLARSQSPIQRLAMESLRLTAEEIIQLLRLMPSLQTFSLAYSHSLTYRRDPTIASLVLPNLKELAVAENADFLSWTNHPAADDGADGVAVVEMARLHLAGPKFAPALEARLAAVCTTGCVVDYCVNERYE
ncbi:hypothetical protein B0H14DRAFT_2778668 [Mycena olivaceomarginata]|nr:hypothetical protein B0H14DRAFT_2778668 [Mycena olivaceomarginata]